MGYTQRTFRYKGVRVNAFGIPVSGPSRVLPKDKRKRDWYHQSFECDHPSSSPKNMIVMYDIPHHKRRERDWFRRHLVKFGYVMIQKSVWVGPSPLPKDFVTYVKSMDLEGNLKTFKLAKAYIGKEKVF